MGFDNECILNIQSLAGEYFCPVCRLLVYPNEALQSQCTHLYCKPCLTYIVSTTRACPYDGYLVTEADSKPLIETNKTLSETIGKIAVHCLYHRSGCTWQGQLSDCITHCTGCAFGNSPVVCNRCGTQIVHRQVQEHAQNCPGVQPQAQQADGSQDVAAAAATTAISEQHQAATQAGAVTSQPQITQTAVAPASGQDQSQVNVNSQAQAAVQVAPTPEQWYQQQQQQYQQYYQQYPGYDPYQQQYHQYGSYQQGYQQYQQQQPPHAIPGQQPQIYMQPQPQAQAQPQAQVPVRPQTQSQIQPQAQPQPQSQTQNQAPIHVHPQAQVGGQPQAQAHINPPNQLQPSHTHPQMQPQTYPQQSQQYSQAQPLLQPHPPQPQIQPHLQQRPQVPQQQHPQQHLQQSQPLQQTHPYPQAQPLAQTQLQPQSHIQLPAHAQPQPQPQSQPQSQARPQTQLQTQQHPSSHAVTGHQSYPQPQPQPNQQMPQGAASQLPTINMHPQQQGAPRQLPQQMQAQFPQQQLAHMRPPQSQFPMQQQPAALIPQGQRPSMPPQQPVHPQAPSQTAHQYPGMHPPHQQNTAQQQAHGLSLHPQPFAGQTPGLVQNATQQPAAFVQQQAMQPQLRPQVLPSSLPLDSHTQQHLQQNVPISHGQSQNYAGRPPVSNHGWPHQAFQPSLVGPAGPAQAKVQSGGSQSYWPRPNIRPQSSADQHLGYVHQAARPQSGHESAPFPASAASLSGAKTQMSSVQPPTKPDHQAEAASQMTDSKETSVLPTSSSQGARLVESRIEKSEDRESEYELKSTHSDKNSVNEGEGKSSHQQLVAKEISESPQALEKGPASSSQEGLDESVVKNMVKDEATGKSESLAGGLSGETTVQSQDGVSNIPSKQDGNSQLEDIRVEDDVQKKLSSQQTDLNGKVSKVQTDVRDSQGTGPQGKILVNERNDVEVLSLHEKNMSQSQSSYQGPGQRQDSSFAQPGHVVSASDNQHLPINYGPSHVHDQVHYRAPVTDQMSLQNLHPHQMQVPGPPPTSMRPQGHNILGNMPPQGHILSGPPHLQQPIRKQPHAFHPELSPGGITGAGSSASFGREPGPFGPQGYFNIGQMPPPRAGGPRIHGDPMGGPAFRGPPSGAYDSQGLGMGRMPPPGQQPANPMDSEFNANKSTGYFDRRQPELHMSGPVDRMPFGQPPNLQSDIMKINGGPTRLVSSGLSESPYSFSLQEERFKHFAEERHRQVPEEVFNPPVGERGSNRREFFDDLKHFPRPTHLDSEHVPKSESYFSSSRPLDRAPHGFTSDARLKLDGSASAAASRMLPPYQAGGLRPIDLRDDLGRNVDHGGLRSNFHLSAAPESGRLRVDGLPPLRSPGREYSDVPPSRFGHLEDSEGRELRAFGERSKAFNLHNDDNPFPERRFPVLPSHLRGGDFDGPGNLRIGERGHQRGGADMVGPDFLPGHLRSGGPVGPRNLHIGAPGGYGTYPNTLRLGDVGETGSMHSNLRIGDSFGGNLSNHPRPRFSSGMSIHGYPTDGGFLKAGEMESLDHSRKRKQAGMGWCRLCKVDCETVEGLEIHSQTREHQKMAMDMVMNIKMDNAKKQKLSSDDHISHESETNKARKANNENHSKIQ